MLTIQAEALDDWQRVFKALFGETKNQVPAAGPGRARRQVNSSARSASDITKIPTLVLQVHQMEVGLGEMTTNRGSKARSR